MNDEQNELPLPEKNPGKVLTRPEIVYLGYSLQQRVYGDVTALNRLDELCWKVDHSPSRFYREMLELNERENHIPGLQYHHLRAFVSAYGLAAKRRRKPPPEPDERDAKMARLEARIAELEAREAARK